MKKLLTLLFAMAMLQFCTAQTQTKEEVKFTPPVITKDKPAAEQAVKFTPPVIKKDKPAKTS